MIPIIIKTPRLILRQLRKEDAESIFEYASDAEMTAYVSWETHKSLEDSKSFIEKSLNHYLDSPLMPLGLSLKEAPDRVIGTVGIQKKPAFEGELSYALSRQYWRQGFMFEACSALLDKAFTEYHFKRIFATSVKENLPSKSLMKKLGMRYEGLPKNKSDLKPRCRAFDIEVYAISHEREIKKS